MQICLIRRWQCIGIVLFIAVLFNQQPLLAINYFFDGAVDIGCFTSTAFEMPGYVTNISIHSIASQNLGLNLNYRYWGTGIINSGYKLSISKEWNNFNNRIGSVTFQYYEKNYMPDHIYRQDLIGICTYEFAYYDYFLDFGASLINRSSLQRDIYGLYLGAGYSFHLTYNPIMRCPYYGIYVCGRHDSHEKRYRVSMFSRFEFVRYSFQSSIILSSEFGTGLPVFSINYNMEFYCSDAYDCFPRFVLNRNFHNLR